VGYISRGNSNNKCEDLRQPETQKQFYNYILEKIEKVDFENIKECSLDPILASLRKLREGIVSSGEINEFTIEVFELSSRIALKANNFEELWKSLSYLILTLYENFKYENEQKNNKAEYIKYYLLYLICYLQPRNIEKTFIGNSQEVLSIYNSLSEELKNSPEISFVYEILILFNVAPINYIEFGKLYDKANEYDRILIQCRVPEIRKRTLTLLTKAYFTLPTDDIKKWLIIDNYEDLKTYLFESWKQLPNNTNTDFNKRITKEQITLRVPKKKK